MVTPVVLLRLPAPWAGEVDIFTLPVGKELLECHFIADPLLWKVRTEWWQGANTTVTSLVTNVALLAF